MFPSMLPLELLFPGKAGIEESNSILCSHTGFNRRPVRIHTMDGCVCLTRTYYERVEGGGGKIHFSSKGKFLFFEAFQF